PVLAMVTISVRAWRICIEMLREYFLRCQPDGLYSVGNAIAGSILKAIARRYVSRKARRFDEPASFDGAPRFSRLERDTSVVRDPNEGAILSYREAGRTLRRVT